ncbi:probable chitinase 10 isoform X2 [Ornithodoros turicata]|uniref:probable chitinase 10 isoform X2 n=1 Tax=Ornithodoros turicata TaxID=34597 RepID=UPI003138F06B
MAAPRTPAGTRRASTKRSQSHRPLVAQELANPDVGKKQSRSKHTNVKKFFSESFDEEVLAHDPLTKKRERALFKKHEPHFTSADPAESNKTGTTRHHVNDNRDLYKAANHRVVCVFQARSQKLRVMESNYSVTRFPFHSCHLAVYCCLALDERYNLEPRDADDTAIHSFRSSAATQNPSVKTSAIVGGRPEDDPLLLDVFKNTDARVNFTRNVKTWAETYRFNGIHLQWPSSNPIMADGFIAQFNVTSKDLSASNIFLSLVVEQQPGTLDFDVSRLLLGSDAPLLLVAPRYATGDTVSKPFLYYTDESIARLQLFARRTGKVVYDRVCVILPAAGHTFQLTHENRRGGSSQLATNRRPEGPITKQEGHLAYYEICNRVADCRRDDERAFLASATCGATWISYVTSEKLRDFVCNILFRTGIGCYGIWDSDRDDFPGLCGQGDFPLVRAISEMPLHICR